ncbi:MAG TPA: DNA polymerase I [Spirochaetota bacterium]|nr:DNA polymerase I [Spirochaetota bacterium]
MKTLYVIDGHALCYRAYYAFINNPLTNSSGQNTSAIYGFARMVLQLIREQNPDYLAVAFDPPGKTFRFDMFADYKANRQKMPDDLRSQIEEIKNMVTVFDFPVLIQEGFEADDILGSVAQQYSDECQVYLVTGDKDAYQLVNDSVKIYANSKGVSEFIIYDEEAVKEKLGVTPEQVVDYMALVGDSADNVPGVKGIGPKGAAALIQKYGTIENIYENIDELKGKQKQNLLDYKDDAFLSKQLVTIRHDLKLNFALNEAEFKGFDDARCSEYFNKLEMRSIAGDYFGGTPVVYEKFDKSLVKYTCVTTRAQLDAALKTIVQADIIAVDTETTDLHHQKARLVGISVSFKEKQGYYFPVYGGGLFNDCDTEFDSEELLKLIRDPLENEKIKKVGQNIKFDIMILRKAGINLKGVYFDTMIASYLLNPAERHNMDDMAERLLNYNTIKYSEVVGKGKNSRPLAEVPLDEISVYAAEDTDITLRLYNALKPEIEKHEKLKSLFYDIEMPLVEVLADMEYRGVLIDSAHFKKLSLQNDEQLKKTEESIYGHAGAVFNINSTKELASLLFDKERLGLKAVKKTKTGFSTDISVLEALRKEHPIIEELIRYRTISKLKSTYIDTLPALVEPSTGRIHTSYNQTVVTTGRLSSSDPNLQNIPIKDDFGRLIRKGFVAPQGYSIVAADYSQIELRLAAHISGDPAMCRAFNENADIHTLTASSIFGVSKDKVTADMRRQAKVVNFATIYGVSPYGLSKQIDLSVSEAKHFIDRYFETYPGFKDYMEKVITFARENGFVETTCGRRRYVPEINSKSQFPREGAERVAVNTPIQGTSADMIKIAMISLEKHIHEYSLKSRLVMQVHDELVFELADEEEFFIDVIKKEMESAIELSVPVLVEVGRASNWEEAH